MVLLCGLVLFAYKMDDDWNYIHIYIYTNIVYMFIFTSSTIHHELCIWPMLLIKTVFCVPNLPLDIGCLKHHEISQS